MSNHHTGNHSEIASVTQSAHIKTHRVIHSRIDKQAHLVLPDHPHAAAASSVGCFEDDGEAVGL